VAAVRNIQKETGFVRKAQQFAGEIVKAEPQAFFGPSASARIWKPPTEPYVEHREQERDQG
jgi:hypothetical protein